MDAKKLIVDSHEDLAWNMISFGRDYTRPAAETRRLERGALAPEVNGDTLLGWPDYQRGRVGLVFATLFSCPQRHCKSWETLCYADVSEANRQYRSQVDAYERLVDEHPDCFRLVKTQADLTAVLERWAGPPEPAPGKEEASPRPESEQENPPERLPNHPVGLTMLMEGAEGVRAPGELEEWWELGVRLIGPAWAGTRYCGGTREPGPLTSEGFALLEAMAGLGFCLDVSHMDEAAVLQALDIYPGRLAATHANAHALLKDVDSNRFLSDRVIRGLLERDAVIGVVPLNSFLLPGWKQGDRREPAGIERLVAQIDYLCQMAGDARHVGIGSDFDGGFGVQSVPPEIDTIADLQKLDPLLTERGYSPEDIALIFGRNWINLLRQVLPEGA